VLGMGSASNGLGIVIGSVLSGLIVDAQGLAAAFFFGGAVMALGVPVFLFLTRGEATTDTVPEAVPSAAPAGGN